MSSSPHGSRSRNRNSWSEGSRNGPEEPMPESLRAYDADPESAEGSPGAPQGGAEENGRGKPPKDPEAARSEAEAATEKAVLRMLEMSQGFANAGAEEVEKLTGLLDRLDEDLLERLEKVLSALNEQEAGLLEAAKKAAEERKALEKERAKTRQAGQKMRADFLKGLQKESGRIAGETGRKIEKSATAATERTMRRIEERQGEAVEATSEAAQQMSQRVETSASNLKNTLNTSRRAVGATTEGIRRAVGTAWRLTWKERAITIVAVVLVPTLIFLGVTWMRPGWSLSEENQTALAVGQNVMKKYNRLGSELYETRDLWKLLRAGNLSENQRTYIEGQMLTAEQIRAHLSERAAIREALDWTRAEWEKKMAEQLRSWLGYR